MAKLKHKEHYDYDYCYTYEEIYGVAVVGRGGKFGYIKLDEQMKTIDENKLIIK